MKGFIKSYADFLGLDSADVMERYKNIGKKEDGAKIKESKEEPRRSYRLHPVPWVLILFIIVFIVLTRFFFSPKSGEISTKIKPSTQFEGEQQKPVRANRTAHGIFTGSPKKIFHPLTASKTSIVHPAKPEVQGAQVTKMPSAKYNLLITAKELTWLKITVDNKDPVEALMKKGETTIWAADKRLIVLSGNAGGVELTLNGKPLESLGPSGKVATKVIQEE